MDTSEFTDEQIDALQALADGYNDQSVSRRDVMKLVGAGGVGALLGGGGMASATEPASAGTAQSGQLGTVGDPVDVEAEDVNAASVTADEATIGPQLEHLYTLSNADLGRPHDIEITNGLGVVPGKDGNVSVVGLYPRQSPSVLTTDTTFTNAQTVAIPPRTRHAPYGAWIADETTLYWRDVYPAAIGGTESYALTSGRANGSAWFVGSDSEWLFVASKDGQTEAFDVTDPKSATSTNAFAGAITNPHDCAILGTRLIVCEQGDGITPKLETINALNGDGESVQAAWSSDGTFSDPTLNGANRLEVLNQNYLVVASNYATTLSIIEMPHFGDTTTWSIADSVSTGAPDGPSGMTLVGDYCITASNDRVTIWDVSDPTSIGQVDQYIFGHTINGHDPAVDGRYLYVTGQWTNTIEVFDLGWEFARDAYAQNLVSGSA